MNLHHEIESAQAMKAKYTRLRDLFSERLTILTLCAKTDFEGRAELSPATERMLYENECKINAAYDSLKDYFEKSKQ